MYLILNTLISVQAPEKDSITTSCFNTIEKEAVCYYCRSGEVHSVGVSFEFCPSMGVRLLPKRKGGGSNDIKTLHHPKSRENRTKSLLLAGNTVCSDPHRNS